MSRVALIQCEPRFLAVRENLALAARLIAEVTADIFVLPELVTSGYSFAAASEVEAVSEAADHGSAFDAVTRLAREKNAWIAYGFPERRQGRFFNSANLIGPDGLTGTYRKIQVFGRETLFFSPGEDPAPVFDLPFGRVGLMICFDWYFPEVARSLALRGAELILHPANLVLPHCPQAMITRSLENRVFSATCDRIGVETNGSITHAFIGSSQIVSPRGELLVRLSNDREEVAVVDMNLLDARSKRLGEYNDLFRDRRPGLYAGASSEP